MNNVQKRMLKKTTHKQFDLLIREIAEHPEATKSNAVGSNKVKADMVWEQIADKVNAVGPPFRSVSAWKKVWSDLRGRTRKKLNIVPEHKTETESSSDNTELNFDPILDALKCKRSLPARNSTSSPTISSLTDPCRPPSAVTVSSSPSKESKVMTVIISRENSPVGDCEENQNYVNQTLYSLQQQVENQSKFLEYLIQMTSSVGTLMERQIAATERQAAAIERQAVATEQQSIVMQSFVELLQEKTRNNNNNNNNNNRKEGSSNSLGLEEVVVKKEHVDEPNLT